MILNSQGLAATAPSLRCPRVYNGQEAHCCSLQISHPSRSTFEWQVTQLAYLRQSKEINCKSEIREKIFEIHALDT